MRARLPNSLPGVMNKSLPIVAVSILEPYMNHTQYVVTSQASLLQYWGKSGSAMTRNPFPGLHSVSSFTVRKAAWADASVGMREKYLPKSFRWNGFVSH